MCFYFLCLGRSTPIDTSGNQFLEFFLQNHIEAPEYNTSHKEVHSYPRGSLFLSICVHEFDEETNEEMRYRSEEMKRKAFRQVYRIDVPLKIKKDAKNEKISMTNLTNLGLPVMDTESFEKIVDNYRLVSYCMDNPYVLIPRCTSYVSVTLTVSQVRTINVML